jgi:hypothetical protein
MRVGRTAWVEAEGRSYPSTTFARAAIIAALLSMLFLLGVGAPVASAAPEAGPGWAFKGNFGEGSISGFGSAANPVAVDGSGNIFASAGERVKVYSPSPDGGTLLTEFSVLTAQNIAVDPSDGTAYVDAPGLFGELVRRYVSDGAPTPTYSADPTFGVPQGAGMAVDPTTGDLLIADPGAEGVRRYDSSGTLLETIATPSIGPAFIVTAPDGSFYVSPGEGDVTHFSGPGTLLGTISGVGSLHGLAYDASRSLIVAAVGETLKSYSTTGTLLSESPSQGGSGRGLAVGPSGTLYEHTGSSLNYYAPGTAPGVEAPQVSALAANSAHVSAEVDPGAGPPENSVAHFEVSADGGQTWPEELKTADEPVERTVTEGPDTIEAHLTGLKANADYLVRVVAANEEPISSTSAATPFHTLLGPPEVETGPANSVTETSAKLTGTIDTFGGQTTYHFEYGLTASYGSKVPAGAEAVAGNEKGPRTFSRGISGLQPNTTYHYRLVAKNSAGETVGEDRTFTTSGAGVARGYEQVSPRNKMGGSVNPALGFQVAANGSAIEYQVSQAPANANSSVVFNRVLSRRSSTGWLDWSSLDPPLKVGPGGGGVVTTVTGGISSDFKHTVVVSDRVLTPVGVNGPYEGGGNIYIQDLETGAYTFVGGAPGQPAFEALTGFQRETWFISGAPDFSWVILNVPNPMLPGAPNRAVYKWSRDGGLELESRLPDGSIPVEVATTTSPDEADTFRQSSDDGSVVYFSLATAGSYEQGGVYRRSGGQTTAISVSHIPGDPDTVHGGQFEGTSADGRYAFFTSRDRLSSDAPPDLHGGTALYRYDAQSDTLEFIDLLANLPSAFDVYGIGDDGQTVHYLRNEAQVSETFVWSHGVSDLVTPSDVGAFFGSNPFTSPNGRFMAYQESDGSVHLYDAESKENVCVTCVVDGGTGRLAYGSRTISNRHPEVVNDEGELYFDTADPLLAEDHNGTLDVYQYHDGRLTLISPGDGPYDARFADATPDGSDVFFTTDEGILPGDTDRDVDVYDARVGGGFPEADASGSECEGEGCKGTVGRPPDLETPKGGAADATSFAIKSLRPLSSADRKKLAKGGTAHLRLSVSRAGTVKVTGKKVKGSSAKAKGPGAVSVPFSLTKAALTELKSKGRLQIKLSVHFGDANQKVVHFTLNAVATKKGGRS